MDKSEDTPQETEVVDDLARVQKIAKAGDLNGAELLLAKALSEEGAPFSARILYVRVLLKLGKKEEALNAAMAGVQDVPQDSQATALLAQTYLHLRRTPEARTVLAEACREFTDNVPLNALHAEALLILTELEGALEAADSALAFETADERAVSVKIVVLDALNRHEEALALFAVFPNVANRLPALYRDAIAGFASRRGKSFALGLAKNACELLPGDAPLHLNYAERLLTELRAQEALEVLNQVSLEEHASEELQIRFFRTKGRALQVLRDHAGAVEAFASALALRPEDQDSLRSLYVLHQKLGQTDEMRAYGTRLSKSGAKTMPETLSAGLDALHAQPPETKIVPAKIAWAWELAKRKPAEKAAWLAKLQWGHNADKLMKAWWLNLSDRSAEIDALIDPPVRDALGEIAADARCVCVTTHMGPMAAGVRFLQTCGRPYRGFGYAGPDPVVGDAPPMRIAAKGNTGLKELIQEIRNGTLIGFAPDSPNTSQSLLLDFCGQKIALSTMVPRLVHMEKAASVWWQPLWRDGRIVMELERLPDPEDGEDVEAWCRRWAAAYLTHAERVVRGAPENLNCGSGFWANVG